MGTEKEADDWFSTQAGANEVAETDEVEDTDEVVVEEHTNAVACAISFFFPVVFAVTVFIFGWIGVVVAPSPALAAAPAAVPAAVPPSAPADDVGQSPTTRNRSGRRMAGRRRARPGAGSAFKMNIFLGGSANSSHRPLIPRMFFGMIL